jgi:hypothetical protein
VARRTPDAGVKPFEIRAGMGMPALGGMFRAGDPAQTPPNRHHLLVNARITPAGMRERPGFVEEYNTGVAECITGLAGGSEEAGVTGLLIYPGLRAVGPNGSAGSVPSSFRKVGEGGTNFTWLVDIQKRAKLTTGDDGFIYQPGSGGDRGFPFWWRGKLFDFQSIATEAGPRWALFEIGLPRKLPAYRAAEEQHELGGADGGFPDSWWTGGPLTGGLEPAPRGTRQVGDWPLGALRLVTVLDNSDPATTLLHRRPLVRAERADDALTGEAGILEVLYWVRFDLVGGNYELRVQRFDGVTVTEEYSPAPAVVYSPFYGDPAGGYYSERLAGVALEDTLYGPALYLAQSDGTLIHAARRGVDGAWVTTSGLVSAAAVPFVPFCSFTWNGKPYLAGWSYGNLPNAALPYATLATMNVALSGYEYVGPTPTGPAGNGTWVADARVRGRNVFILGGGADGSNWAQWLMRGSLLLPEWTAIDALGGGSAVGVAFSVEQKSHGAWIESAAGRIFVGGTLQDIESTHKVVDYTNIGTPVVMLEEPADQLSLNLGHGSDNQSVGCVYVGQGESEAEGLGELGGS